MSKLIPALVVALFTFFLFFYGACISGLVLREPDICFLLATGRWIAEHGQLPTTDPFSYSMIYTDQPYVSEKWLTEIVFYELWKWTSAAGLLVFDAMLMTLTFAILPYRYFYLSGVRGLKALLLTCLTTLTSFSHLTVRPENISFLIMAIYLEILIRLSYAQHKLHWRSVIILVLLMVLWSNSHTLFIVGLMMLSLYTGCLAVERLLLRFTDKPMDWTVPISLALCIPATLVTPYGLTLWRYLPTIFGPFNDTNNEMQPVGLSSLSSPFLYPFFVLALVSVIVFVRHGVKKPIGSGELFFQVLLPAGIAGGFKTLRSIPISALFASSAMARLLGNRESNLSQIDEKINQLCQPMSPIWITMSIAVAGLGAWMITTVIPLEIPQGSAAFAPPRKAIAFIDKHRPSGRMLNDPHFGNVMMWQLEQAPPVFIDSRYNLFGNTLLQNYWTMAEDKPGSRALLDKYAIDWIFLNPKMQLVKSLSHDPQWTVLYEDGEAAVIGRNNHR